MIKKLSLVVAILMCLFLISCSSSAEKTVDLMHFQLGDVEYAVPDSWNDDTSDPDMYVHMAGDQSVGLSVMRSEVDPETMTFFEYLDSQEISYESLEARADGVTLDGAEYTNKDGDLVHTYYYVSQSGSPYMMHVYLFSGGEDEERDFLDTLKLH